ncbi:hypothetical protein BYT27DRAFT_6862543 [Phlegmacium glaucopus]|nr:hypothetical protein BYT27DRAFT_6862543 [Phlegmacium glaucopus]
MTRDFLTDQARSKSYYRDKSKYIELAAISLRYLAQWPSLFELGSVQDQACSTITQEILSRFPRESRLVWCLRTNHVREDLLYRWSLVREIKAYIKFILFKDYDLGKTEAPQSHSPPTPWEQQQLPYSVPREFALPQQSSSQFQNIPSAATGTGLIPLPESVTPIGSKKRVSNEVEDRCVKKGRLTFQ